METCPDRVNVYSGAQEVRGCRVPNRVRPDSFMSQSRAIPSGHFGVTSDDVVHAESCHRSGGTTQKHSFLVGASRGQFLQDRRSGCPQRAKADLVSFPSQLYERLGFLMWSTQSQIANC
jgi:hypothetical protein